MTLKVSDIGEFELIDRIRRIIDGAGYKPGLLIHGIGDDAAVFTPEPGFEMVVTCDSMVEGRHYLKAHMTAIEVGRRAMVMNISDIGAMGGIPLYALVTLGLTSLETVHEIEEIYRGFIQELEPFNASIIGGNITKTAGNTFIDITLIGKANRGHIALRSGAKPGDAIMVTGYPGSSGAGYRLIVDGLAQSLADKTLMDAYLRPAHRAREGHELAVSGLISSMMDVSDGLPGDLYHICETSSIGAELWEEMLPVSNALNETSAMYKISPVDFILAPSDDYELLFTCVPQNIEKLERILAEFGCPVTHIGDIVPIAQGMTLIKKNGKRKPLNKKGWDHFTTV
ncbi:MAG: thiamine-phosphate kinase [Desulfatiglans sp.]|jgi:thiamine-monophosphate kinase|nr:thiamine-phosphate kinase [Desulfatiglans sp.]